MNQKDDLQFEYDDDDAVAFIQNFLPQDLKGKFSNDDLSYIIDLIYEYYFDQGFLNEDQESEEVEIDEDELIKFVVTQAKKNKIGKFTPEEVEFIVQGELAYCDTLNLFD